eukprot:Pompholyxophrys_punicea_v1_NODE_313_length_2295_cov_18.692411.p1 type:complete len:169 gc:universal NODE_313_length_2295_cov_18.692411:1111-1617(+)
MQLLTKEVEQRAASKLVGSLGLFWMVGMLTVHFVALFACIPKVNHYVLIALSPLLCEDDFSSQSHKEFIESVLVDIYGKSLADVGYLVEDNVSTNKHLADLMGVPFIGCASHRLNLAVNLMLEPHEPSLDAINSLMKKLSSLKKSCSLETKNKTYANYPQQDLLVFNF